MSAEPTLVDVTTKEMTFSDGSFLALPKGCKVKRKEDPARITFDVESRKGRAVIVAKGRTLSTCQGIIDYLTDRYRAEEE